MRGKKTCKPGFVPVRDGGQSFIYGAGYPTSLATYPGALGGLPCALPYLVLPRAGFTKPAWSPGPLVGSYSTLSPLPGLCDSSLSPDTRVDGSGPACFFLWHFPLLTEPGSYPAPCPVGPGLSSRRPEPAGDCPVFFSTSSRALLASLSASLSRPRSMWKI